MSNVAKELLELLDIEQLEVDLFRGVGSGGETTTRIFGGHVIAQALMAAYRTVPDRLCHSLHAYFIRPGDPSIPVIYQVDRARDGGSFTTRRVVAIQHGKQIFNLSASFHVDEEGWNFQHEMPKVGAPEDWPSRDELREANVSKIPEKFHDDFMRKRPIEIREVAPRDFFTPEKASDENHLWFRMEAAKGQGPQMQHCLLAYASDMNLLGSSLRPHGLTWFQGNVMSASLDHAMWFHAPIQFNDWHLYDLDAPWTGKARGFNRGAIYNADGTLVASVAQEGLVRPLKKMP
ncbi:acyl-CoA thioesterase [Sulfitobacter donghicola]|uniref:Acyl-CoA thioesterase 2 n=1 Tax=Sulfitobacter donghicola DSW-25 = KCTC 12864 = JCM 14565 TaxID=1300350 RepID=A0A073IF39_9RHOB|nr:acyl-CoA thioesterase II [Sulfitobacter donghicola]KEJ88175.1 acyl-CoA thioesterase [Sulfitobacter donghicola DSW-25 = KCTC 12864 = JCM 14565]KIN70111.1 Acyl-CoA thioesterase II [Sulfitobacter donghicola DSW-25 = KCTC 12864 = JCM 14565]